MYEVLTDRVGFVPGGVNIGVIRIDDKHCLIVDSGLNDSTARKVLRWITEAIDSEVVGILTTHGHADHFGAHAFVLKRTGARVFAPEHDAAVIRNPLLQPIFLYGGADPLDTLRNRFLLADPSVVDEEISSAGARNFMGVEVNVVALPGHSMNQVGYLIDGVFFCADVVFPQAAIEKYRIPYLYGLSDHIASLEHARTVKAQVIIPGHGPRESDFDAPYNRNRAIIDEVLELVADVIAEPVTTDVVATEVFRRLDVPIADHAGYFLLRPTIAAYLAHLQRTGTAELDIDRGAALWHRT